MLRPRLLASNSSLYTTDAAEKSHEGEPFGEPVEVELKTAFSSKHFAELTVSEKSVCFVALESNPVFGKKLKIETIAANW